MSTTNRQIFDLMKMGATFGGDHYPETLGKVFVLNAPMVFGAVWAFIKGFMDEKTRRKFTILGGDYQSALLEAIDADQLP
mgnify:CR=1 FL=1